MRCPREPSRAKTHSGQALGRKRATCLAAAGGVGAADSHRADRRARAHGLGCDRGAGGASRGESEPKTVFGRRIKARAARDTATHPTNVVTAAISELKNEFRRGCESAGGSLPQPQCLIAQSSCRAPSPYRVASHTPGGSPHRAAQRHRSQARHRRSARRCRPFTWPARSPGAPHRPRARSSCTSTRVRR